MLLTRDQGLHVEFFQAYLGETIYGRLAQRRLVRGKIDLDLVILNLRALLAA
jgi:hypothetical protein